MPTASMTSGNRSLRSPEAGMRQDLEVALKRILVLEDDELFSMLLKDVFIESGYKVEMVEDGASALAKAPSFLPDILFADWRFSGTATSVQVAECIRSLNPRLKVILLTGIVGEEANKAASAIGAFRLLTKPSSIDEILNAAEAASSALDADR